MSAPDCILTRLSQYRHDRRQRRKRPDGDEPAASSRLSADMVNRNARPQTGAGSANGVSPVIISASRRPVAGPSVRPWCWWPKSNHSPAWRGALPITGSMSGRHGRAPIQGFASTASPSGNSACARGSARSQLDRRRRRIAAGKLHAGGEANAAVHRRQQIAEIGIEHRMIEHGIAARRQMQMIAALDAERDRIAERTKHQIGPRSERHHDFARDHRAVRPATRHPPVVLFERSRIADDESARPCARTARHRPWPVRRDRERIRASANRSRRRIRRSDWARAPRSPCHREFRRRRHIASPARDRAPRLASVASERNSLIQPVRRNSSGTPASAISASCSIRLRRISGNSAIALCSARSGEDARK